MSIEELLNSIPNKTNRQTECPKCGDKKYRGRPHQYVPGYIGDYRYKLRTCENCLYIYSPEKGFDNDQFQLTH